jgi:hypothetical protein
LHNKEKQKKQRNPPQQGYPPHKERKSKFHHRRLFERIEKAPSINLIPYLGGGIQPNYKYLAMRNARSILKNENFRIFKKNNSHAAKFPQVSLAQHQSP